MFFLHLAKETDILEFKYFWIFMFNFLYIDWSIIFLILITVSKFRDTNKHIYFKNKSGIQEAENSQPDWNADFGNCVGLSFLALLCIGYFLWLCVGNTQKHFWQDIYVCLFKSKVQNLFIHYNAYIFLYFNISRLIRKPKKYS